MSNKANVVGAKAPQIVVDGRVLKGTLSNLKEGVGARPMSEAAIAKVRTDAIGLLEKVVRIYSAEVAPGEVGAESTGKATAKAPLKKGGPTGLLYGRVQSGKTVAMITFTAAAIDNGFKVIVVLTSDNVKLVSQTADRFAALDGALIRNSNTAEQWGGDAEHIKKHIEECGVVFICTKNQQRLTALVDFLAEIGAAGYPSLVLDDEADQATLDTTVAARKAGRKPETERSAIHEITVNSSTGHSIRQTLRHHVFIQVTATPYALLLQNLDSELRPSFTHLIEPGAGYTGGEAFFDAKFVQNQVPPLVFVPKGESEKFGKKLAHPPEGLQRAIAFFLVASGSQSILDPAARSSSQNFLCHTSQKTTEHEQLATLIRDHLTTISDELRVPGTTETLMRLQYAYDELEKTLTNRPPLDEVIGRIKARLPRRQVPIVNSANGSVEFGRELNFIVGGNILGRGLTIENLLVTYYLRRAKISQMDTVLQHARMYGYRESLMPYTRVYLPEDLAGRFYFLHTAEQNLRRQLSQEGALSRITVETLTDLRATRLNVLDTSNLTAFGPGQHIFPGEPALDPKSLSKTKVIEEELKRVLDGEPPNTFVPVEPEVFMKLLHLIPYDESFANSWDPEMFERVLRRVKGIWDRGYVYWRTMSRGRKSEVLTSGAFSGDELARARAQPGPVLACFKDDGAYLTNNKPFWYPSFVFPSKMPTQVFNLSSDE